jgi:predicted Zn-dependent peptidase
MIRQSILENGIRVVSCSMPTVRSISMGFLFSAGPGDEPVGKNGIAHLTEHLMFQGTDLRSADEIARMMDATGGQIGGFTSRDYTCYTTTVLDDYRTYILDLLGDILLHSNFADKSVRQEKETIARELQSSLDHPDSCAHERLKAHVWQDHPLGRTIGGTVEAVAALTRQDVVDFVDQHYRANRLIIAAAGNLDHEDMVANVRDAFWSLPAGAQREVSLGEPEFHPGVTMDCRNLNQVYFSLGLKAAPFTSQDRYLIHLLTSILGGGMSSRLFHKLRQDMALVYDISAEYQAYRDGGLIVIEGATTPELIQPVLGQILTEVKGMAWDMLPLSEEELWIAKMQLKGQHVIAQENTHTTMSSLATQAFYFDRFIDSIEIVSQIEEVSMEQMRHMAGITLNHGLAQSALSLVGLGETGADSLWEYEQLLADFQ